MISYKIISKWPPSTPLSKITISFQFVNYFNSCSGDVTLFPWVMCKWKKTKGRNQQTVYSHLANILNKRPTGLNRHLSISDFTLTPCQRGAYLHTNRPIVINKNQQLYMKAEL